ncbi:HlyD family secretion protein [Ferrimonas balearica]|uniref:HlyD family secretion protein n=1 Tax=Ferrimonas balearica TaxID=44012 RepID=UPI001C99B2D4|nr:HlyD family secretion protein [Ferrimonas balearica]MBY5920440.1 HlyD family secretion protein [Ferrimonas balearica]MBY5996875.1 HlyD family secretion protein [Ferrimonas balearica]
MNESVSGPSTNATSNEPAQSEPQESGKTLDSARRFTFILLFVALTVWIYTLWVDRLTPMTDHVRVNGQLIRLSPQVSAQIEKVLVPDNARVSQGQPLIQLEKHQFQLKVDSAKAALQQTTQSVDADTAAVAVAKANQVAARVRLDNSRQHAQRNVALAENGVISQSALDDSLAEVQSAEAQLAQATANLEKAKQALGPIGENNPQLKSALNQLDQALLNLSYTTLYAPGDGVVTNMELATGDYAGAGKPLLTYINNDSLWLTAMVREISLAYVKPGTPVKIILDSYPGRSFQGEVQSIGWGSAGNGTLEVDPNSGLMTSPNGLQHAQRFPVNIRFLDLPDEVQLRYGGRATVSFYPGQTATGEKLLDLWTWIWSYLSYVS